MDTLNTNFLIGVAILGVTFGIIIYAIKKDVNLRWLAWYTAILLTIMLVLPLFNAHLSGELLHIPTLIFVYWLIIKKKIL